MKKVIYLFFIIFIILGGYIVFDLSIGGLRPSFFKRLRVERLKDLKAVVENNLEKSKDYDNCLHEIYKNDKTRYLLFFVSDEKKEKHLLEKSDIESAIQYAFYHDSDGWCVIEKKTVEHPFYLMIDHKGNIYELRPVQEK